MPAPSRSERVSTLTDPSDALADRPVSRTNALADRPAGRASSTRPAHSASRPHGAGAEGRSTGTTTTRAHPVHWLVDGHWLGRFRSPLLLKLWRYGAGSIVAALPSFIAYPVCFGWFRFGAIASTWISFVAGAVPNWILNRQWAWQKRGTEGMARETTLYVIVSLVSLAVSSVATKLTATGFAHDSHATRNILVTSSYIASVLVLSALKYLVYDHFVFVDRKPGPAAEASES